MDNDVDLLVRTFFIVFEGLWLGSKVCGVCRCVGVGCVLRAETMGRRQWCAGAVVRLAQ